MNVGDEDYYYIDDDDDVVGASWRRLCQCSPIDPLDFAILDRGHQHLWQEKKTSGNPTGSPQNIKPQSKSFSPIKKTQTIKWVKIDPDANN